VEDKDQQAEPPSQTNTANDKMGLHNIAILPKDFG